MSKEINLYKVECHGMFVGYGPSQSVWIYVAATDCNSAQEKAMDKMRALKWKYDSRAGSIEVVASGNPHQGNLFVV